MKKQLFFAALALTTLAGCTDDTFVGDQSPQNGNATGVIQFTSSTPNVTRGTGSDAAETLGYKFRVYATKTVTEGSSDVTSNVFAYTPISTPDDEGGFYPYWVWYQASTGGTTTSNTKDWEYVGAKGSAYGTQIGENNYKVSLGKDQTIKYWDYSAKQYDFVAYSATVGGTTIENYTTSGFTVTTTPAGLAGLYIANKITLQGTEANTTPSIPATTYNKIGDIVQFTFRSSSAKVRLGIYETIPGYDVKDVVFYYTNGTETSDNDEAYLDGKFVGSSTGEATYAITYNGSSGIPELAIQQPQSGTSNTTFYNFGSFDSSTKIGETSTAPTWASAGVYTNNYIPVFPNTVSTNIAPMLLKVDYTLHNGTTGETIKVTGAKAAVPDAFMKWQANHAYTYLFKISPNTNGSTGQSVVGLYPITLDAVTISDESSVGTITTVTTPSITTYQAGSVVDVTTPSPAHGVQYKTGTPIYLTVQSNVSGDLNTLFDGGTKVGGVQVYSLGSTAKTEADLQLNAPTGDDMFTLGGENTTVDIVALTANKYGSFTPTATGYYAIQYLDYDNGTLGSNITSTDGYYTRTGESAPYTYAEATGAVNKETTYYKPVYTYKVVYVEKTGS